MTISVELMTAAHGSAIDRDTNSISIFEIIDELNAPSFPLLVQKMVIVVIFRREKVSEAESVESKIRIVMEEDLLFESDFTFNFNVNSRRNRTRLALDGFVIPKPGIVRFEILLEGKELGSHRMWANVVDGPRLEAIGEEK
jgi:Family of unknown function (DUF6941)